MERQGEQLVGDMYSRQQEMPLTIPNTCTVVGVGGTGLWVAYLLAMCGVPNLILIDDDNLEVSNLNRLPASENWVGSRKVDVAYELIHLIRPECNVTRHSNLRIDEPGKCTYLAGIVFCCTDNLPSQQLIHAACDRNGLIFQRVGYDGTILNVSRAFGFTFEGTAEDEPVGYQHDPSWVIPAVMAAAAGISSVMYVEINLQDDISKLATIGSSHVPKPIKESIMQMGTERAAKEMEEDRQAHPEKYVPAGYGTCGGCNKWDEEDVVLETESYASEEVKKTLAEVRALGVRSTNLNSYLDERIPAE
jgi:hypothetical protein